MPVRLPSGLPPGLPAVAAATIAALALGLAGAGAVAAALGAGLAGAAVALIPPRPAAAPSPPAPPPRREPDLLESLPVPLVLLAASGRVVRTNAAARQMFPRLAVAAHVSAALRAPAFLDSLAGAAEAGAAREITFTHAIGGKDSHLKAHLVPFPDPGETEPALLVLVEDHTADRRLNQMRADFVANASHELRTPLAAIIGYIETLQGPARDDAPARERFLGIMDRQAQRMKRLVDDLMSLSRIEMTEHVPPRTPCGLEETVREAVAALVPSARDAGAEIALRLGETPTMVPGDRDQLIQVFVNLIDNALRYSPAGAPVAIEAAPPSPSFPGMAGISVIDRGPGIAREHIPRLTERFYRVSTQTSRAKGGTGLGLAIVKHVLNRHRGLLQVESTPGEGSRFTVWLPRAPGG